MRGRKSCPKKCPPPERTSEAISKRRLGECDREIVFRDRNCFKVKMDANVEVESVVVMRNVMRDGRTGDMSRF